MTTGEVLPKDFPDVELVVIRWLKAAGLNVSSALPSAPTWPALTVTRVGGSPDASWAFDRARIQFDAWGSGKADARALIVRALLLTRQMRDASPEAEVLDVAPDLGVTWLPDDSVTPPRPRYVAGVLITLR